MRKGVNVDERDVGRKASRSDYRSRMGNNTPRMQEVSANGIDFHYLTQGSGPLALCLHGFPDTAHSWIPTMSYIADAGFTAVAPMMRGYAPTSLASDGCYQTAALAHDAVALHEALGGSDDAIIIGHDWGAPATYGAALLAPERWKKVVGMAVPPGPALGLAFLSNLDQVRKSWYMFFFQHGLSDIVVAANNYAFIDKIWADWSPTFDSGNAAQHVKDALSTPENLSAALGYYRAALGDGYKNPAYGELQSRMGGEVPAQPLLYMHGENDGCIGVDVMESSRSMSGNNVVYEIVKNAGHFLQLEQPQAVGARIADWITS